MSTAHLLVEIGTEELPPKALRMLATAFGDALSALLDEQYLLPGDIKTYATPRRLAVHIENVLTQQVDRDIVRRGPNVKAAFDKDGKPTKPAEGFARSCGVAVEELARVATDKGECLAWHSTETGKPCGELLPGLVEAALKKLPIPKRMRWGNGDIQFVRPIHWVLVLQGDKTIDAEIMGIACGRNTYGHRFHHNQPIELADTTQYLEALENTGKVIADIDRRRNIIREQVEAAGKQLGGHAQIDAGLLDEVTALVEWPVAVAGDFDPRFLDIPGEALITSMQDHQKFFPVADSDGKLMPHFITVANIASTDINQVKSGNERVIRPRLDDADFFWTQDRKLTLESRIAALDEVTYQKKLGSLGDKQQRIAVIATQVAETLGADIAQVQRAAALCKCDLLTSMVGEFPGLQGTMGRYYALNDNEDPAVAAAIGEQYQPRFAGDSLPTTPVGQAIAIADRLDSITGIFAVGQPPTGDKDPFGLRRAALGILRTLIDCHIDLDLVELVKTTATAQLVDVDDDTRDAIYQFMMERLRTWYLDAGHDAETFDAVMSRRPASPLDFDQRMQAVKAFALLPEAESLSAANKRISNILRKAEGNPGTDYKTELFQEDAEKQLAAAVQSLGEKITPLYRERDYTSALGELAALREPVDRFFDDVMVMADDPKIRDNRLALLSALSSLFLDVADISRLQK